MKTSKSAKASRSTIEKALTAAIIKALADNNYNQTHAAKLLGITRRAKTGIELRVHPTLIPARRLIANVEGVMNAVLVKGDAVGPTLYYGAGAGALPTGSAVVADLVDGAPKPVKEGISKADAEAAKKKLEEAGAKVEVK